MHALRAVPLLDVASYGVALGAADYARTLGPLPAAFRGLGLTRTLRIPRRHGLADAVRERSAAFSRQASTIWNQDWWMRGAKNDEWAW